MNPVTHAPTSMTLNLRLEARMRSRYGLHHGLSSAAPRAAATLAGFPPAETPLVLVPGFARRCLKTGKITEQIWI